MPGLAVIAYAYTTLDESREGADVIRKVSGRELSGRHKHLKKTTVLNVVSICVNCQPLSNNVYVEYVKSS
jgi:hypothetical protein